MEPPVVASGIPDVTQMLASSTSSVALPPSSHRHPHPMSTGTHPGHSRNRACGATCGIAGDGAWSTDTSTER
ncbi:hypothetical protein D8674_019201 [Pyrus ussuriensis x Pyrus communis]|uniref:Uncharacterized protein n=1 Tax=Pyrus ussuriensis x Pyrus communis TaxID=2448454 RepID=A0A5N5G6Y1_9ROSA|nr:hypothetical protein D8674_019201 [Pyrus ussuriensis x Pyrus communis]